MSSPSISKRVQSTLDPPISLVYKWAESYIPSDEHPLLDMSQGVPGSPAHRLILDAWSQAAADPTISRTYGLIGGELGIKQALAKDICSVYQLNEDDVTSNDVAMTAGCNLAFGAVISALTDVGDEVILTVPSYFNHHMTLNMMGLTCVPLHTFSKDGFLPTGEACENLINSKTKAVVLVTPNNPTGAIYPPSLLASMASLAKKHSLALILDETYRNFLLTPEPPHALFHSAPDVDWRSHIVHLYSFSKAYHIPAARLGAIVASPILLLQTKKVLDCWQICPPRAIQIALAPLMREGVLKPWIKEDAQLMGARQRLFREHLKGGWITIGEGVGYFAYTRHPFVGKSSAEVCERLAKEMGVIVLPGSAFDLPMQGTGTVLPITGEEDRWVRCSVANKDERSIEAVCARLTESVEVFGWDCE